MSARRLAISIALVVLAWAGAPGAGLPTVSHEGRAYVELKRVAASLKSGTLEAGAGSTRARLRTPGHVVTFTRNRSQILVNDRPLVLDAPVRVKRGVWLVPESFVGRVLPKLAAGPVVTAQARRAPAPAAEVALDELRFRSYPSFTRIVLETSSPVTHKLEPGGPREARIRLVGLGGAAQTEEVRDGFVAEIRFERAGADALLRVVFEGAAGPVRASALADPPRVVLDFTRPADTAGPGEGRVEATPLRTIVLDAGHGGHDSGAVGPTGLMEKELVLDVTRRVARLVEERLGIKVLVTRDTDVFVALRDRTSFANKQRADLFVSIHANAHRQAVMDGVETYFLSSEATDSTARQVAALENGVVQLEKAAGRGGNGNKVDIVKTILWDLAQSEFQIESERLAGIVNDSMTQTLRIGNRGVKQAGFYVLGGAAMPAILLEIGFVTNPKEERRLKDGRYRDEIARAIFAGLAEYKRHWDQRTRAAGDGPSVTRAR
jgi:N-acetylmuramoyl-L-alanine amidase